ncbi:MAG: hypothetical protein ACK5U4_12460, partial [Rhodospirillales bacterium]
MPMPTAAELHELREAWIRAPRGRRLVRERALREAVAATLKEELGKEELAPKVPTDAPAIVSEAASDGSGSDESGKHFWQRGQY